MSNATSKLNRTVHLLYQKKRDIEDLTYETNLIEEDIINQIKTDLFADTETNLFPYIVLYIFKNASFYFHDEQGNKDLKQYFDYVIKIIYENILDKDDRFKLVDIRSLGFEDFDYVFTYEILGKTIQIEIPMYETANSLNYQYLLKGYCVSEKESEGVFNTFIKDRDYHVVRDKLKEWVKK